MGNGSEGTVDRALAVFAELCDLPLEEQRARLTALAADDAPLAAQVDELLRGDRAAEQRLEEGAVAQLSFTSMAELQGGVDAFTRDVVRRLEAHRGSFGRYEIEGELARGGQGVILRIRDDVLDRHLAMKVVLGRSDDEHTGETPALGTRTLVRFLEEAHVTSRLDHPGIVPVHDLGLDADGQVYFTMKLVKGKTLEAVFGELSAGEGGWTRTRVLGLLLKVCEAMSYAHAKGVIHRDLKPLNVMVGRYGEVYVMDWGLARVVGHAGDERARPEHIPPTTELLPSRPGSDSEAADPLWNTMNMDVVGTPAYMSPEQAMGAAERMGPASDVYALGAMLYHMLAGHRPYVPPGANTSHYAVWRQVQSGPPPALHGVAPDAAAELTAICEKAMNREPSARYADMSALAADLTAYLEGHVVHAYETGAVAELRKWIVRNRPFALALAAALAALVLGLASSLVQRAKAETFAQQSDAERGRVLRLADTKRLADLIEQARHTTLLSLADVHAAEGWIVDARALLERLPNHRADLRALSSSPSPNEETDWHVEALAALVEDLERFGAGDPAVSALARMEAGVDAVQRSTSAPEAAERWATAIAAIADSVLYEGFQMEPQLGLIPLGQDPDTGLWEFAHVVSGAAPDRETAPLPPPASSTWTVTEETGLVMVLIPAGTSWMGAQRTDPAAPNYDTLAQAGEQPVHEVRVEPFFLSKFEMTWSQWRRAGGALPDWGPAPPTAPIVLVSWEEAVDTLGGIGLLLPTEVQWEYAARAGTATPWWTGDDRGELEAAENVYPGTMSLVGAWRRNGFGLHDVSGNVREWCLDAYSDHEGRPVPGNGRVIRGAGHNSLYVAARSAARDQAYSGFRYFDIGVRPARIIRP
jgi:serine/threonine protein kinase/formylglycine-generating enzyme required for sulfatase activity